MNLLRFWRLVGMSNARVLTAFKPNIAVSSLRRILALLLLFCLPLMPPAQAGESLVNTEVSVDVTGKDAADARTQAMAQGEMDALVALLNRLTTPDQVQTALTGLDNKKVSAMVRGVEVLEERISANRYRARLLITFDGDALSMLVGKMTAAGNAAPDTGTVGSFLVIPAYEETGTVMLWEESNPWRSVWKTVGLEINSGDLVVPYGDNADMSTVDAKTIGSANYATLTPLTVRYGVSDIVVLQAKFTRTPDMVLNVVKRHISRSENEVNMLTYRADPQETKDTLLLRAARDIAADIQQKKNEDLASVKQVRGGEHRTVMILASITTLSSWTYIRNKLSGLPMVDQLELIAMSPRQVDIVVHYRGSPDSLTNGIQAQGLRLVKTPRYWVVSRD